VIVVSQDKKVEIKYDKIDVLMVEGRSVRALKGDIYFTLGVYENEERAMEVKQEITREAILEVVDGHVMPKE
jgi:hypothetical protein